MNDRASLGLSSIASRPVAQLAEQRSPKPQVGGSIPSWPAKAREVPISADLAADIGKDEGTDLADYEVFC